MIAQILRDTVPVSWSEVRALLSISNHSKEMPIKRLSEIVQFLPNVLMRREDESDSPHCRVMNSVLIILQTGHDPFSQLPDDHQHLHGSEMRHERGGLSLIFPGHAKHRPRKGVSMIILCKMDSSGSDN